MGLMFRKLEVKDLREIETLITEHAESIESDLKIIDSRLLLGHSLVDLVGLDSEELLVLIAIGSTADEEMLLRTLEAYSWCVEYPDTLRRLYPTVRLQAGQPPRVVFVTERVPDSFVREVKQLVFPAVDCLRFMHLEVNGSAGVYFEPVERIRRTGGGFQPRVAAGAGKPALLDRAVPEERPAGRNGRRNGGTVEAPLAPVSEQRPAAPNGSSNGGAVEATPQLASKGPVPADDPEDDGDWQAALSQLGNLHLPDGGGLSRQWRDFLSKLKAAG